MFIPMVSLSARVVCRRHKASHRHEREGWESLFKDVELALTFLVSACPGALVFATLVAIVAGIGNSARRGVIIKGGDAVEQASEHSRLLGECEDVTVERGRGIRGHVYGKEVEVAALRGAQVPVNLRAEVNSAESSGATVSFDLIDLLERLMVHIAQVPSTTLTSLVRQDSALQEHRAMVKAISKRDADTARDIARKHFTEARELRLGLLRQAAAEEAKKSLAAS